MSSDFIWTCSLTVIFSASISGGEEGEGEGYGDGFGIEREVYLG